MTQFMTITLLTVMPGTIIPVQAISLLIDISLLYSLVGF